MNSNYLENIRRIAKVDKNKSGIEAGKTRKSITEVIKPFPEVINDNGGAAAVIEPPLTLEILTYDDALDVLIEGLNGEFTIKTAETAILIDAAGTEFAIDTIIYPVVP